MSAALLIPRLRLVARPLSPAWQLTHKVADGRAKEMEQLVLAAIAQGEAALNLEGIIQALEADESVRAAAYADEGIALMALNLSVRVPPFMLRTLQLAGEAAAAHARKRGTLRTAAAQPISALRFDLTNPEAVKWARERSSSLIKNITRSSQEAIRKLISRSHMEGIPARELAGLIKSSIGLDPRRSDAVQNLRKALKDNPGGLVYAGKTPIRVPESPTTAFLSAKTQAYADRLLNQRARSIARTETLAASNEGQRNLWMQSVDQGFLRGDELRKWIITGDRRICPICEGSAGDLAPINQPFPNGLMGPPAHPMCRCATGLSSQRGKTAVKIAPPPAENESSEATKALDTELRKRGIGDAKFGEVPGSAIASDEATARRVAETFDERVRLLKKGGLDLDLGGSTRSDWQLAATTADGRARIATINTGINQLSTAVPRMREMGAIRSSDKLKVGFTNTGENRYAHAFLKTGRMEINFNQPAWMSDEAMARAMWADAGAGWHPVSGVDSVMVHETGHVMHGRLAREAYKVDKLDRFARLTGKGGGDAVRTWQNGLNVIKRQASATRFESLPDSVRIAWTSPGRMSAKDRVEYAETIAKEIAREVSRYAATNINEFVAETYTGLTYGKTYGDDVMRLYKALGGPPVEGRAAVALVPKPLPPVLRELPPVVATPVHPPVTPPLAPPVVPPEVKLPKALRPIPADDTGAIIRQVHALRELGKDYTEIAKEMGWDVTRRAKGWGKGPQRAFDIIKKYGDPLGRVAPRPLTAALEAQPSGPAPAAIKPQFDPSKLAKGQSAFNDFASQLQAEYLEGSEFAVIDAYQSKYKGINTALRGSAKQAARVEKTAKLLDKAIGRFTTTADTTAYRGGFLPPDLKKGARFVDKGFVSTTTKESIAKRFAKRGGPDGRVFEIIVPKGTKAIPLPSNFFDDELEILLGRGHTFKVVRMDKDRVVLRLIK